MLQYRGNMFSQLSSEQQSALHAQLPLQCHSLETLQRSGVILDTDPLPQDTVNKKQRPKNIKDFRRTSARNPRITPRKAIAIACHAAETPDGGAEPVSICVIDFLTGQTLIDSFIAPPCEISDWKTDVHGVSARTIENAVKGNNCLQGWREARTRLCEYVGARTIFVGCAIWRDLALLRVFHRGIVDAKILAMEALFTEAERANGDGLEAKKWEVDGLCMGLLGMEMRAGGGAMKGKRVRDPYEDVLVAREIVLRFLQRPGVVRSWVKRERLAMFLTAFKEGEKGEEDAVGMGAKRAWRRPKKKAGQKGTLDDTDQMNQKAKRSGNRKRKQAEGTKGPMVQSPKELSIGEARRKESPQDGKQKAVEAEVGTVAHVENVSKNNKEQSGNGQPRRKTRKEKKQTETEARDKAKREASLKAMVREEERKLLTCEDGKQGARRDWEARNGGERRVKWMQSQRDE